MPLGPFQYLYPEDPPAELLIYNRREFLARFPDRGITIESWSPATGWSVQDKIAIPDDTICCDLCNADPGDEIYLVHNYAYCTACARKYVLPHCPDCPKEEL